jgi:hypothetical protein
MKTFICKTTIRAFGQDWELSIYKGEYAEGGMAVMAETDNEEYGPEPFGVLSAWLPVTPELPEGHFHAKTYSENEEWFEAMIEQGLIEKTGFVHNNGWMDFPICRFTEKALGQIKEASDAATVETQEG